MATRLQITCIKMADRLGGHEKVLRVGGSTFNFEMHQAVVAALTGEFEFFLREHDTGKDIEVKVNDQTAAPEAFLQAHGGGEWRYDLLHLPQCVPPGVLGVSHAIDMR